MPLFPEKISPHFKKLIEVAKSPKALINQVKYNKEEDIEKKAFVSSPVKDQQFRKSKGIIQKYAGRILIVFSGKCPSHCRYCFRREFPYSEEIFTEKNIDKMKEILLKDTQLQEVIISGGEPLSALDDQFKKLIFELKKIKQVSTIRVHSRMLTFAPHRFKTWIPLWKGLDKKLIFVSHFNHSDELSEEIKPIIYQMKDIGFTLLNQSVLLRNVNDNVGVIFSLSKDLFEYGILPYYLHQLDRVRGAHHFEVSKRKGRELMGKLKSKLPGYLVPKYVREIPGEPNKTLIC